jgi:hypothetical protein
MLLCAIPLHAQARIPLRVGLYISDTVLKFSPGPPLHHIDVGKHVAETASTEFQRIFTSVVRLREFTAGAAPPEELDCVIVVEIPKGKASAFGTLTVTVPFSVYQPSGALIFQTAEVNTRKTSAWSSGDTAKRTWFEMADAEVASFLDKFSQTELARKAVQRGTTATLKIASQPVGAQAFVDEKLMGVTSVATGELVLESVPPGSYNLRLTAAGYQDWAQSVTLPAGNVTSVEAKLAPRFSQLALVTQPGGVQVYLDDTFKGTTSEQEGRLRIENLAPGSHQVRLSLAGYKEWSQQVTSNPGETLPLTVKLEPAGPKPLALAEIEEALTNGLPPKGITKLVNQYGVDFALTKEVEQRLREKGADGDLLVAIATNKK